MTPLEIEDKLVNDIYKTIAVYFEDNRKSISKLSQKNIELLNVKIGGTQIYNRALKG